MVAVQGPDYYGPSLQFIHSLTHSLTNSTFMQNKFFYSLNFPSERKFHEVFSRQYLTCVALIMSGMLGTEL
jgi:hypothetical protein